MQTSVSKGLTRNSRPPWNSAPKILRSPKGAGTFRDKH